MGRHRPGVPGGRLGRARRPRIDVDGVGPHTTEGIRVGSTFAELQAAYPDLQGPIAEDEGGRGSTRTMPGRSCSRSATAMTRLKTRARKWGSSACVRRASRQRTPGTTAMLGHASTADPRGTDGPDMGGHARRCPPQRDRPDIEVLLVNGQGDGASARLVTFDARIGQSPETGAGLLQRPTPSVSSLPACVPMQRRAPHLIVVREARISMGVSAGEGTRPGRVHRQHQPRRRRSG